jgi:hypothetical protein
VATRPPAQVSNPETALAATGSGPGTPVDGAATLPADSLVREAEAGESAADGPAADHAPASEETAKEQAAQRREEVRRARPVAPDPAAAARTSYESAAAMAESERNRARQLGAPQLAPTDYERGESLRGDALGAAQAGRYSEAQGDMERALSAFADAAVAATSAATTWREKLDSARAALEPLRAEADESSAEYAEAKRLQEQAAAAQREGRYQDALQGLSRAAEAYSLAAAQEEPAAEADPAPEPSAEEIAESVLGELRHALETEDLAAVQRVWVGLTRSQLRGFETFFGSMHDLNASFDIESLERSGDRILLRVNTNYDYVNEDTRRRVKQPFTQSFEMAQQDGRWVIVASRGS